MAITYNKAVGFESGDVSELDVVQGTPTFETSSPPGGTFFWRGGTSFTILAFDQVSSAGNKQMLALKIRLTTNSTRAFITALEGATATAFRFRVEAEATDEFSFEITDFGGGAITGGGSTKTDFAINTWYELVLIWDHSDSGEFDLYVDDVSQISVSGEDFSRGGTLDRYKVETLVIDVDDVVTASGLTSVADRPAEWEVLPYPNIKSGSTFDGGAFDTAGSNTDGGVWNSVAVLPFSDALGVEFTGDPDGARVDAAVLGAEIDGDPNVKFFTGIWRLDRDGGGGTTHSVIFGNSNDTDLAVPTETVALTTTITSFVFGRDTDLPLKSVPDAVALGIWTGGAQDIHCYGMVGTLLHVPSTGATTQKSLSVTFTTTMANTPVKIGVLAANIGFATAMALERKTGKVIAVAFDTGITVTKKITPIAKAVAFVTSMVTTPIKIGVKVINVAFGTAFSLSKFIKRTFAVAFGTGFTVVKKVSMTKAVSFVTAMALTKFKIGIKAINVAFVTTMSTTAVQLILRTFNVAFVTTMSTTPVPIFVRIFNVTFGTAMSLAKTVRKNIAVAFVTAFSAVKKVRVTKTVAFVTTMSLVTALFFTKALSVPFITGMTLTLGLTLSKALSVTFTLSMSLVKKVLKTFTVGFSTGFGLAKKVLVTKPVSFVTSMARTTVASFFVSAAVSFVTTMVTTPIQVILKSIAIGFVTAFSTATRFISGIIVPTGAMLMFMRRRRWGRYRK